MPRLILLVQHPYHLSTEEAAAWLREQAATFATTPGIEHVALSRLSSLSQRFSRDWDWLFELQLAAHDDAADALGEEVWTDLLGDLRVLGMKSSVAMADTTTRFDGERS